MPVFQIKNLSKLDQQTPIQFRGVEGCQPAKM
jgi:hypothetical protein